MDSSFSSALSKSVLMSGMLASAMRLNRFRMRTTLLRRMLYASQQYVLNLPKYSLSVPPMASTISLHSFIGGGKILGSRPMMNPKSMWNILPSGASIRLSR